MVVRETLTRASLVALAAGLAVALPDTASAVIPAALPDEYLAKMPVIVVARWRKATPITPRRSINGNGQAVGELHTEIVIERVVSGGIEPGTHELLMTGPVGWEDGGQVVAPTSSYTLGDAKDVFAPNLWFLEFDEGRDKEVSSDKFLSLRNYRCIQPLNLEPYFLALSSDDPRLAVPKLLSNDDVGIVERSLIYIAGGAELEPSRTYEFFNSRKTANPVREAEPAVKQLLQHDDPKVRYRAAGVYASLRGRDCVAELVPLLNDSDQNVRDVAIAVVSKFKANPETIQAAMRSVENPITLCQLIHSLMFWNGDKIVPALISTLQQPGTPGAYDDDHVPGLRAQRALRVITGADFPRNVDASRQAWSAVVADSDSTNRTAKLQRLLRPHLIRLRAEFVREDEGFAIRLTNSSSRSIRIAEHPALIQVETVVDTVAESWTLTIDERQFVSLSPAETLSVRHDSFTNAVKGRSGNHHVIVYFPNDGTEKLESNLFVGPLAVTPAN